MQLPTQVVVLAGGISRRFTPFNHDQNKAELLLMGKPLLWWTLDSLQRAGFSEVLVVVSPQAGWQEAFWEEWRAVFVSLQVVVQPHPNGQAGALQAAKDLLAAEFVVVNANQLAAHELVLPLTQLPTALGFLVAPTQQAQLYGAVAYDTLTHLVTGVTEKPTQSDHGWRLVGIYRLTKEFVLTLPPATTGDDVLEQGLHRAAVQQKVSCGEVTQTLPTLKYAWHLLACKELLWSRITYQIHPTAIIAPTAVIRGQVVIGAGAVIGDHAIVDGPAYIGEKAVVGQYCVVRKGCVLEAGAQVQRHADVSNSILMKDAHLHSGFVGDSIIGARTTIGAGFVTANRRMDRGEIYGYVSGQKIATGLTSLGACIGSEVQIGIQVGIMPGVLVAAHSQILPKALVDRNVGLD